jgi:cytochrome P450
VPLVIRRKNFKEFEINGHLIPKGSAIIPMISVLLADEKVGTRDGTKITFF